MRPARIAELLAPFLESEVEANRNACHSEPANAGDEAAVLSQSQLESISMYIDILLRWNARINLTAVRNEEEIVTRHFGESLFAARHLFPDRACVGADAFVRPVERSSTPVHPHSDGRATLQSRVEPHVADLGSGAGFPGLPIKLWAPSVHVTLIESNHRKAAFLREVARALTLTDINIQTARAETLVGHHFDVVTLRAVERFSQILPTAASLVAPQGRLALLIGASQVGLAQASLSNAKSDHPPMSWSEPQPIPQSRSRVLLIATRT